MSTYSPAQRAELERACKRIKKGGATFASTQKMAEEVRQDHQKACARNPALRRVTVLAQNERQKKDSKAFKPSGRRYRTVQALIREQAIPDEFSYHEMLDRVSIYNGLVDDLAEHPVAIKHLKIRLLIIEATQVLTALYEEAAKLHPGMQDPPLKGAKR